VKRIHFILLILTLFVVHTGLQAQEERFAAIEGKLKDLSRQSPGLNDAIDLSVNNMPIADFLRGIATSNNINLYVDPGIDVKVSNNFTNISPTDIFVFLCRKYDLDINVYGSIVSFSKYVAPAAPPVVVQSKKLNITYSNYNNTLSMDLSADSLVAVVKAITRASQKNVVIAPELAGKIVNGYIQNMAFDGAMDKFAFSNDLKVTKTLDEVYLVEKKEPKQAAGTNGSGATSNFTNAGKPVSGLVIKALGDSLITVSGTAIPIAEVVAAVSAETRKQYYLFSELKGNATLNVNAVDYDTFLRNLLNGTDFTYKKQGEIYFIGDRAIEGLRATKIVQLKFRSIEKVIDFIPAELKKGVDIKTFSDLNSLILSGSQPRINEIEAFLRDLDRVVPNISIEIIILEVKNTKSVSTGIQAGLGTPPTTAQTFLPGFDYKLSTSFINNIIDGINGLGNVNLGKVSPSFYIALSAMETNNVAKIRSTPKIATLNGHEAKLSIGSTEYYLEIQNVVTGGLNNTVTSQQNYRSVNADLAITINPIVSGDEQITLDIKVKQSTFTPRISATAPPGNVTRDLQSLIRVKNEEMILLGGLEQSDNEDSGTGVPLLSRIPVLKWLFSSRTKKRDKNKLVVLIKPTVVY